MSYIPDAYLFYGAFVDLEAIEEKFPSDDWAAEVKSHGFVGVNCGEGELIGIAIKNTDYYGSVFPAYLGKSASEFKDPSKEEITKLKKFLKELEISKPKIGWYLAADYG